MTQANMAYVGAALAIVFGVVLLWYPPTSMAGQASTVGTAMAFITGGLAAFGVTVTVPTVAKPAEDKGYVKGYQDKSNNKPSII